MRADPCCREWWASERTDDGNSSVVSEVGTKSTHATKLLRSCCEGDLGQVCKFLDSAGAGVNALRARGTTPLHEAAKAGQFFIMVELLRRSAEVAELKKGGCTALHYAALCKNKAKSLECSQLLLDSAAQANAKSERLDTPLHFAAYCRPQAGVGEVLRFLIVRRADVNARNRKHETPLMNAVFNENADGVRTLAQEGADFAVKNTQDKTAHDLATDLGNAEVLQALEETQDPMKQLTDVTQQMRTALTQMQTIDSLSDQLRQQAALTEAFENVATVAMCELEPGALAQLANQTLSVLRDPGPNMNRGENNTLVPTWTSLTQHELLQTLASLLLIARCRGGPCLLQSLAVPELIPVLEQQLARHHIVHREIWELRSALSNPTERTIELGAARSASSSASSAIDDVSQFSLAIRTTLPSSMSTISPSASRTAATNHSATPRAFSSEHGTSTAGGPDFELNVLPVATSRRAAKSPSLKGQGLQFRSAPCIIARHSLPHAVPPFSDERPIVPEEEQAEQSEAGVANRNAEGSAFLARGFAHSSTSQADQGEPVVARATSAPKLNLLHQDSRQSPSCMHPASRQSCAVM